MKILCSILRFATLALCAGGTVGATNPARAAALEDLPFFTAAADCYAIGQQVAEQNGGTLAKASQTEQGGQPVCVIVVLVPGKDGQRPRRMEFVVPQN